MTAKNTVTVQETFYQLNKRLGIENIKRIDELPQTKNSIVSTGVIGLDIALGVGGIKKESMGIGSENFYVLNVDTIEKALEVCKMCASSFGAIVIDSLAGTICKAQMDGDVGDSHVGTFARIMSDALPMLVPVLADNECTLIVITQLREKVGVMFGNPERATGGRALKYYASVRLDMRGIESIKNNGEEVGRRTRVKVVKNKIATPFKSTEFDIMFGQGISVEGDALDQAVEKGIITKYSAWYSYNGNKIGQGRENAKQYLKDHPTEFEEIVNRLRDAHGIA